MFHVIVLSLFWFRTVCTWMTSCISEPSTPVLQNFGLVQILGSIISSVAWSCVWVRGSLVTLPTFGSLVTLPTLLGRVASDPLVLFLWPCSLKNTSPRILFLVVACDPTYLFGRVASDHFLALAIPKHLPWPDLHSDRIWPYSPTCHRKHGFCVAGATIVMPLRWSPLTLYMLVGKGQMAFVWQVQQFRCLWDVLPWPYTCWLGSVKWLLCGRCNNFDASEMISPDTIHACWEGSKGFCVAGATIVMPLRWSPLTLYMLVGKGQMAFVWQVQQFRCLWDVLPWPYTCWLGSVKWLLCGRCNNFRCLWDDLPWPYTCLLGRVKWLSSGRCNNFDASEMISPDPIHACWEGSKWLLCGRCNNFRCLWDDLPWPYTCLLGRVKWLLSGRCNNFDASEMISPDPIHACWEVSNGFCVAGATILMPLRWSPLTLYMLVGKGRKWLTVTLCGRCNSLNASEKYYVTQCLATLVTLLAFCVEGAEFSMAPRSSLCIRSACVAGAIF